MCTDIGPIMYFTLCVRVELPISNRLRYCTLFIFSVRSSSSGP